MTYPDKDFTHRFALTFHLIYIESWFKVTAHSLTKDTLRVKYETEQAKGEEICSGHNVNRQMDIKNS